MQPSLFNNKTDWHVFSEKLDTFFNLNIPLKTEDEIDDAVYDLSKQNAGWYAPNITIYEKKSVPVTVKEIIAEKLLLRKLWRQTGSKKLERKQINKGINKNSKRSNN